jgi:hypothetical protein
MLVILARIELCLISLFNPYFFINGILLMTQATHNLIDVGLHYIAYMVFQWF